MKTVFTTGSFDLLHTGHINLLRRAKEDNNFVIVGLNSDELIASKNPIYTYEQRRNLLEAIKYVDAVVPIRVQEDKFMYITELKVDEFVIGDDYKNHPDLDIIRNMCSVRILERTPDVSTTRAKEMIHNTFVIDIDDTISITHDRDFENSEPIQAVIDKINELHNQGFRIILFTARGMKSTGDPELAKKKYFDITSKWLISHNVIYDELIFGKPNADYYVDDKSLPISEFLKFGGGIDESKEKVV